MKKSLKNKWIHALRSGKIVQGQGKLLLRDGSMCCLGVLCLVSGMSPKQIRKIKKVTDFGTLTNVILSKPLLKKFGLTDAQQKSLTKLNDNGVTFEQIASHIEEYI